VSQVSGTEFGIGVGNKLIFAISHDTKPCQLLNTKLRSAKHHWDFDIVADLWQPQYCFNLSLSVIGHHYSICSMFGHLKFNLDHIQG